MSQAPVAPLPDVGPTPAELQEEAPSSGGSSSADGPINQASPVDAGNTARSTSRNMHVIESHPNMPALSKTLSGRSVPLTSRDHAGMSEVIRTLTEQSKADKAKEDKKDVEKQSPPSLPTDNNGNFDLERFLADSMGTDDQGRQNVPREMSVVWKVRLNVGLMRTQY